jgi:hypothetical protein
MGFAHHAHHGAHHGAQLGRLATGRSECRVERLGEYPIAFVEKDATARRGVI